MRPVACWGPIVLLEMLGYNSPSPSPNPSPPRNPNAFYASPRDLVATIRRDVPRYVDRVKPGGDLDLLQKRLSKEIHGHLEPIASGFRFTFRDAKHTLDAGGAYDAKEGFVHLTDVKWDGKVVPPNQSPIKLQSATSSFSQEGFLDPYGPYWDELRRQFPEVEFGWTVPATVR